MFLGPVVAFQPANTVRVDEAVLLLAKNRSRPTENEIIGGCADASPSATEPRSEGGSPAESMDDIAMLADPPCGPTILDSNVMLKGIDELASTWPVSTR